MPKNTTATSTSSAMRMLLLLSGLALEPAQSFQLSRPSRTFGGRGREEWHRAGGGGARRGGAAASRTPGPSPCLAMRHDYERDTSADASAVDVAAVDALLGERLHARKTGDFEVADRIRDRLSADYRVTVFDKNKMWVTGEGAANRGGRSGDRGGRGGGRGGRRERGRGGRGGRGPRNFRSNFGPNGHDYEVCPRAGPNSSSMTEAAIHEMVAERLMAKMNRDFGTADNVQLQLAEDGIFINDRTKEWRADGVQFIDPSEGRRAPRARSDRNRPYVQSRHSEPVPENAKFTGERIRELVAERTQYKLTRAFGEADAIKDALEQSCNVFIDDRVREWSVGGSFGKDADVKRAHNDAVQSRSYAMCSASLALPAGVAQDEVQARVDARTRARASRRYEESDALRAKILEEFNVVIHDTLRMWSVGGDFGPDDPDGARTRGRFTRRGGGQLSEEDVVLVEDMLRERWEAKGDRNFELADGIRSDLYNRYSINVDDKAFEWRVLSDDYVQTEAEGGAQELNADEASVIEAQLAKRIILKKNREYEEADAIRDHLQDQYSIHIDDKKHEWNAVSSGKRGGVSRGAARRITDEVAHDPWFDDDDAAGDAAAGNVAAVADVNPEGENIAAPPAVSREDLMSLTVPLLKEKLREAGAPVSGRKAELVDRLLAC